MLLRDLFLKKAVRFQWNSLIASFDKGAPFS